MAKTILIIGTLDTKGAEFEYVRDLIQARGLRTLVMDTGVMGLPLFPPDFSAGQVAEAGGGSLAALRKAGDRGAALEVMGKGARALAIRCLAEGKVDGVISLGGSGGTSIAAAAMQALPVGLPKIMVSTMASGNVGPYVDVKDITLMYSVVDVAGLNRLSRRILANAAGAVCGMAEQAVPAGQERPLVTATMFGVTTPCVNRVREILEEKGYEVLVFHATGSGGRAMESLIADGFITGVADISTTEWCDELVGGVLSAGPARLDAAGSRACPRWSPWEPWTWSTSVAWDTVPAPFKGRVLYKHNPTVTLMRTTAEECADLGRIIAEKLNRATGPTALFVPLRGVSMIDAPGQPFYAPEADQALFQAVRRHLDPRQGGTGRAGPPHQRPGIRRGHGQPPAGHARRPQKGA